MDERHSDHRQNQQAPEVRGTPVTHPRCAGRGLGVYPVNETPGATRYDIPLAKAQAGFTNGTWLHDGKGGGLGVIVFATQEDAESAQGVLKPPPGGPQLKSSEIYEVGGQA